MGQPDPQAPLSQAPSHFAQPITQILTMLTVLGLVGFGVFVALPRIGPVFLTNPLLNGFILFVFTIGVIACFWQVFQLIVSVKWIDGFVGQKDDHDLSRAPRLLAPLASLLRSRGARMQINATSSRSILDSVGTRIDEARDITRYIVNLLIFLGLLGTFYGLATTVPALIDTIGALAPQDGEDGMQVFTRLIAGLKSQLGGMGTAFASSLLGLSGSLVVGLLELFASHGQNRFYRELEEWLSTITRLGFASGDGDSTGETGAIAAIMDHLAEQMDAMQTIFTQTDIGRVATDEKIDALTEAITALAAQSGGGASEQMWARIATGQEQIVTALNTKAEDGGGHIDAESRMRLRSIDVQMLRILEEISAGRQESTADLRGDIAELTRAVRDLVPNRNRGRGA